MIVGPGASCAAAFSQWRLLEVGRQTPGLGWVRMENTGEASASLTLGRSRCSGILTLHPQVVHDFCFVSFFRTVQQNLEFIEAPPVERLKL